MDPKKKLDAILYDIEFSGLSHQEIGTKYSLHRTTIQKIMWRHNIKRKVRSKRAGPMKAADMKSLSPVHRYIGSRLTIDRGRNNLTTAADNLGVSRYVMKMMELGVHDFKLTEIQRIATQLKTTVVELIDG